MGEVEEEAKILERVLKRDMEKWPSVILYELARMGSPLALEELERRRKRALTTMWKREPLDLDL
jgi:DNA-binding HxlR family transcriptional regulator